jgi:hypothetical protein
MIVRCCRYVRRATEVLVKQMQESRAKRHAARIEARKRDAAAALPQDGHQFSRKLFAITEELGIRRNVRACLVNAPASCLLLLLSISCQGSRDYIAWAPATVLTHVLGPWPALRHKCACSRMGDAAFRQAGSAASHRACGYGWCQRWHRASKARARF